MAECISMSSNDVYYVIRTVISAVNLTSIFFTTLLKILK